MKNKLRMVRMLGVMLAVFCLATSAFAQTVVKGSVNDAGNNQTLPGATVKITGTTTGTTTDVNGKFSLSVPTGAKSLTISFVGYTSKEVEIGASTVIDVALASDAQDLEGIVVTGYGSQKKSSITGAVSSVKGNDLTRLPMQRVDQALQGKATGVMVVNTAGAPGAETIIRIRGMNSINGGNSALVVIDGLQGGNLSSLNPNDIESIEILKDAAATAIYGSRGANGVLLITTKGGKKGKPMIDYSYSYGSQTLRKKIDLMNAYDYALSVNKNAAMDNSGGNVPNMIFTDAEIAGFKTNGGTDWQDEAYRAAAIKSHQITMSGGADNISYLISGGYLDQQGILLNTDYTRYSLRANFNAKVTERCLLWC